MAKPDLAYMVLEMDVEARESIIQGPRDCSGS